MLETDWSKPRSGALARLGDHRVRQYWDSARTLSAALRKSADAWKFHPECCDDEGILWDMIAVFPPGAEWKDAPPKPSLVDGTVVDAAPRFEAALNLK